MTTKIIVFLSSCICYFFSISLSWKSLKANNRYQSKRCFQMNLLFSERFTDAIKECNSLGSFSTIPLPKEFSEIQGVIAKKQTLSVISKTTIITNTENLSNEILRLQFSAAAYNSSTLKYLRKVELNGGGFNVFNFVIFPDLDVVDLPIFGVDIISLPGICIVNLYFDPINFFIK